MGHTTVRINETTRDTLRELARAEGRPMQAVLEQAVETLRRQRFLEAVNSAYGSLRGDAKAWAGIERDRRDWDSTLLDGLGVQEGRATYRPRAKPRVRRIRK
jgi:hypothetical protein